MSVRARIWDYVIGSIFFVHTCWGMGIAQLHTLRAVVSDALGIDVHSNVCANFVFGLRYGHALV